MSVWVYAMVSKRNGATYVGVTNDIEKRAYTHVIDIEKKRHPNRAVRRYFRNHTRADIRFEKLEFVQHAMNGWHPEARQVEQRYMRSLDAINKPVPKDSCMVGIEIVERPAESIRRNRDLVSGN